MRNFDPVRNVKLGGDMENINVSSIAVLFKDGRELYFTDIKSYDLGCMIVIRTSIGTTYIKDDNILSITINQ